MTPAMSRAWRRQRWSSCRARTASATTRSRTRPRPTWGRAARSCCRRWSSRRTRKRERVRSGLVSVATAALVATVAGVGGTLPVVLAAAQAVGATPEQASSWVSGLGIATALSALFLSLRYRMPIITAWSTPGAALIASTSGVPGFRAAVGAFVLAAVLILLTAAIRPLGRLIERIPPGIAAAMLAGILLRLVVAMIEQVPQAPLLVLPLIALFLVARGLVPTLASLIVLAAGAALAWSLGLVKPIPSLGISHLELVSPAWDLATLIGLGVPLYLVTMASQNLPGFAVLRASGYQPPHSRCWVSPAWSR